MNRTLNNETTATKTKSSGLIPFPSHVTKAFPVKAVKAMATELTNTSIDKNNIYGTPKGNVHFLVRDHYIDTATGTYGIESLIASILKDNNAIFPAGIDNTEFRTVAIASSFFVSDMIDSVQAVFGKDRYPYATIHSYLSHFMTKNGKVAKIKLTNAEDKNRPCCKPRCKYYLVESQ